MTPATPFPHHHPAALGRKQRGIAAIAAIAIVVVLGALAGGIFWISSQQQLTIANDMREARLTQLAYAGLEWAAYRAKKDNITYNTDQNNGRGRKFTNLVPSSDGYEGTSVIAGFTVWQFEEKETSFRLIRLTALACSTTTCPNNNPSPNYREKYVERLLICEHGTNCRAK